MSGLIVRLAAAEDFDEWFAMCEQVAIEGRWIGTEAPIDRDQWTEGFHKALDSPTITRFVATLDGRIIGDIGITLTAGRADLGMMVREGFRGQGVGSALMQACIDWSCAAGAHKVTLGAWPHNEAGIALYLKFGFVIEGRRLRHYRRKNGELWDALDMGLVLNATAPGSPWPDAPQL